MSYKKLLKTYRNEMIEELKKFVSINSVLDESTITKGKPFGEGVDKALEYVAELGKKNGFKVDRCDGYATEITIGEGSKNIGIYAHADVVPVSGVWNKPAFEPYVENGNIYGRGTSDDKGPFIAAFFAAKALNELGLLKDTKITMVVGGDEESGSRCLEYYFHTLKKPYADYGFTPDSDFPLIYGEKGISDFVPEIKVEIPGVKSIKGGVASNAVCDRVEVEMDDFSKVEEFCKKSHISYEITGKTFVFLGKSCHGSTPELGDNAALKALNVLGKVCGVEILTKIAAGLSDTTGTAFGGFGKSKLLGQTTYCVGLISYEKGVLKFTVNFRYPENVNREEYVANFDNVFGTKSAFDGESKFLLFDPKTKLVKTLLKAYRRETLDFSKPFTIGGGTYAKHCKNTIAFGALFPGRVSTMHEPNEYMPLKDIYKAADIYATAIKLLGKLK